jgi:hypothetical protein
MMKMRVLVDDIRIAAVLFAALTPLYGVEGLQVYAIDVEGGKSALYVSPSGESMLVDAG